MFKVGVIPQLPSEFDSEFGCIQCTILVHGITLPYAMFQLLATSSFSNEYQVKTKGRSMFLLHDSYKIHNTLRCYN